MYARERSLNGTWTLFVAEHSQVRRHSEPLCTGSALQAAGFLKLNGSVPGNFELDLQAAGLLDDPFFGTNPLKLQELENRHLWYVRRFGFDGDASRAFLRFEGIDTISEIYLNGCLLGTTDNMFLAHEFFAEGIRAGENELVVHIKPVCIEARTLETDADVFVHNPYNAGSLMVRKAAHSFGWDIFPRCISGGLWRGCSIVEKKKDYLQDIYLTTVTLSEGGAGLHCVYETVLDGDFSQDYSLRLTGVCGESRFDYCLDKLWHNRGCFHFSLKNPQLWWPRDLGEPALYDVCATLSYRGEVVDEAALIEALKNHKIQGAALDVVETNLPTDDNPLLKMDNVIVTPHTAAFTTEALENMAYQAALGVYETLEGKPVTFPINKLNK